MVQPFGKGLYMRKSATVVMWACSGVACLSMAGCYRYRERAYVEPAPDYVVIHEPPPPPVVEVRPIPPGGGYIWIDGCWAWEGGRYVWQHGRWALPPERGSIWVGPRYDRHEHGYRYAPGHWERERHEERERR